GFAGAVGVVVDSACLLSQRPRPPGSTLFPYTPLFRSVHGDADEPGGGEPGDGDGDGDDRGRRDAVDGVDRQRERSGRDGRGVHGEPVGRERDGRDGDAGHGGRDGDVAGGLHGAVGVVGDGACGEHERAGGGADGGRRAVRRG